MSNEMDLYKILGVERTASDAEIKKVSPGKGDFVCSKVFSSCFIFVAV